MSTLEMKELFYKSNKFHKISIWIPKVKEFMHSAKLRNFLPNMEILDEIMEILHVRRPVAEPLVKIVVNVLVAGMTSEMLELSMK